MNNSFNVEFGSRMRQARKEAKISNVTAARRIGIDPSSHTRKEAGARGYFLDEIAVLSDLYGVSIDRLIEETCDALRDK